jgi:hypothetical protein
MPSTPLRFIIIFLLFITFCLTNSIGAYSDPCCTLKSEECHITANFVQCNDDPVCYAQCISETCYYRYNHAEPPCDDNIVAEWSWSIDCELTDPYCPCAPEFIMDQYLVSYSRCSNLP